MFMSNEFYPYALDPVVKAWDFGWIFWNPTKPYIISSRRKNGCLSRHDGEVFGFEY